VAAPKPNQKYTYADNLTWDDGKRWELIEGVPYELVFGEGLYKSSAPNRKHHEISGTLLGIFYPTAKIYDYKMFTAPFDVRFSENDEDETVVQPDLSIFCDKNKLDDRGAHAAPDWIIEILSPSTFHKDLHAKLLLYQKYQVPLYWIVDPDKEIILVNKLDETGKYGIPQTFSVGDKIGAGLFADMELEVASVFEE